MPSKIVTDLAVDQSIVLNGPGLVKISAAKTVTVSKMASVQFGSSHAGSIGALKLGSAMSATGPVIGFALLSVGALLLVKQWMGKVDRGECQ
ncbi:MAG: hypothetical protein HQL67_08055 [Magnetococcales bacterium]|nr:hypothetical protein [Magnetococcales bacterium]